MVRRAEPVPLSLDAEEYLSYLSVERGRAASSIRAYRGDLRAYETYLNERGVGVGDVSPRVVEEYLAGLAAAGRAPASRARALAAIRGLHAFALDERGAVRDPTADIEGPRRPDALPKALSEGEVLRLIAAVRGDGATERRDRAILELLYASGARISELTGCSLADLDPDAGLLRLFGKGAKERIVPVGSMALSAVADYLSPAGRARLVAGRKLRRDDADALFVSARGARMSRQAAWAVVRRHALIAGLADKVTPHVLRHSCATHLLDHGADIRVVQEFLGHASITTTQVYTKISQEHLQRAYQAAHPRARAQPGRLKREDAEVVRAK